MGRAGKGRKALFCWLCNIKKIPDTFTVPGINTTRGVPLSDLLHTDYYSAPCDANQSIRINNLFALR